jgi:formylglycine-generating enzyme required for sulfatase activity
MSARFGMKGRGESRRKHSGEAGRASGPGAWLSVLHVALALGVAGLVVPATASQSTAYRETIAGTTVSFEMVPVPGAAFLIGRTEVTWEMYDVFALGLDRPGGSAGGADAIARPSNPYGAPDYGWGHAGFPVISVTRTAADEFAKWLSQKTGRVYRLPTETEWSTVAALAAGPAPLTRDDIATLAWHRGNADGRTHAIGSKGADRLGLFDLFGNAAEWVTTSDGALVVRGGSFRDDPASLGPSSRAVQDDTWNERDPQLPKSRWWLSDGPFVGFRLVTARTP